MLAGAMTPESRHFSWGPTAMYKYKPLDCAFCALAILLICAGLTALYYFHPWLVFDGVSIETMKVGKHEI